MDNVTTYSPSQDSDATDREQSSSHCINSNHFYFTDGIPAVYIALERIKGVS